MSLKTTIFQHFKSLLSGKINALEEELAALAISAASETKSTAGDKHETALAMLQIEQENKRRQLKEWLVQMAVFNRIDPTVVSADVRIGSLVETAQDWFFISVALGNAMIDGKKIYALSPVSPLGRQLVGAKTGDTVEMNDRLYKIISLY